MNNDSSLRRARLCAVVSAVLFFAVLIAGALRSSAGDSTRPAVIYPPEYEIASFAVDRAALRTRELEQLRALACDPSLGQSVRDDAARRLMQLQEWMDQEAALEKILSSRGYDLPVITVQASSVDVVLRAEQLSAEEVGIILELVTRQTGISGGNVKIIPIN